MTKEKLLMLSDVPLPEIVVTEKLVAESQMLFFQEQASRYASKNYALMNLNNLKESDLFPAWTKA